MADTTFKAAVRSSMTLTVSEKTLIDLSNQRANEVGTTDTPVALSINESVLTEAIRLAAAQVEPYLGTQTGDSDVLAVKFCSELALNDLITKHGMNPHEFGLQNRAELMAAMGDTRESRALERGTIIFKQKRTNYPANPSGHVPLGDPDEA